MHRLIYNKKYSISALCLLFILGFVALISLPVLLSSVKEYQDAKKYSVVSVSLSDEDKASIGKEIDTLNESLKGTDVKDGIARAALYRSLGEKYEKLGHLAKSVSVYRLALTAYPKDAEALIALGLLYGRMGKVADGEESFKKALDFEPRNISFYSKYAQFYREYRNDEEAARGAYLEGLIRTNNDTGLMREYASFLESIGEGYEAYLYWDTLSKKDPSDTVLAARVKELQTQYQAVIKAEKEQ